MANGNYDVDPYGDLVEGTNYGYDYSTDVWGGDYSTAPGATVSPSVLAQIAGSVLNAIIPSASAMGASPAAAGAAVTGTTILGRVLGVGGAAATAGTLMGGLASLVGVAIYKLRSRLTGLGGTISTGALVGYGRRIWSQITSWVQKNPGTSAIGLLTGLGLSVEEAAHFLAWGATTKKKRRGRSITAASMRTTRRTIRQITHLSSSLAKMCRTVPHHRRK